jgi:hypothetical protein
VIGFAGVKALPPGCPATVGAVMLVGLRPAVGSTGAVAIFGDLPSCSETAGPTPIVPVVGVPSAFAVPPALGTAAGDCVEGAVVEPIGCAPDDATVNASRPTVTRITMLLFMLEVLQIGNKETELGSDWFGLAAWLPIATSARGDHWAHFSTSAGPARRRTLLQFDRGSQLAVARRCRKPAPPGPDPAVASRECRPRAERFAAAF